MDDASESFNKLHRFIEQEFPNYVQTVKANVNDITSFLATDDKKVHVVFIPDFSSKFSKSPSLSLKAIARKHRVSSANDQMKLRLDNGLKSDQRFSECFPVFDSMTSYLVKLKLKM